MIRIVLFKTEQLLHKLNTSLLSREGFIFMIGSSGENILRLIGDDLPDLVFIDLDLPDMSGAACCRVIKTDPRLRDVPVVILAPQGRVQDVELCRHVGCDAVIAKPIEHAEFIATVKKFIQVAERGTPRYPVQLVVRYGTEQQEVAVDSVNVSNGGIFIETDRLLPENSILRIAFSLPGSTNVISCQSRVAWVNDAALMRKRSLPIGMGLQFLDISPEATAQIGAFLARLFAPFPPADDGGCRLSAGA